MPPEKPSDEIARLANAIRALHHKQRRGDLAELRRMDTSGPPVSNVLQQVLAEIYAGQLGERRARRVALLARILALPMSDGALDGDGQTLGKRMQAAGVSESRLQRLLLAQGEALDDQLLLLARRLANAGSLPYREIGQLILGDARTAERTRYDIARGYWVARTPASSSPPSASSGDQE